MCLASSARYAPYCSAVLRPENSVQLVLYF
jgi:hypothetical protein